MANVTLRSFSVVEEMDYAGQTYVRTEDDCLGVSWYTWAEFSVNEHSTSLDNEEELEQLYQDSKQGYAHAFPTEHNG